MGAVKFFASYIEPNPKEVKYWIDLSEDPYGAMIKYFDGDEWQLITANAYKSINPADYYKKTEINKLLLKKANIEEVATATFVSHTEYPDIYI